jgi:hypothetical protein
MARQDKTRQDKIRQSKARQEREHKTNKAWQDETRQDKKKAMQVDARRIRQDKAWQAKITHDTRQDTKTRHQDKTRQHVNKAGKTRHAIDLSFPLVDSYNSGSIKEICNTVGVVANKKTLAKLNNIGTMHERTRRGNSLTMKQRCADQDINYWPIPVEGDEQTSTSFEAFLNKVCDSASKVGHNALCFKKRWTTILACALAKQSSQMVLRRSSPEFKRLSRIPESNQEIKCHPSSIIPDLIGSDHNNYYHRFSNAYKASKKGNNRLIVRRS